MNSPNSNQQTVLIVEDEEKLAQLLSDYLSFNQYNTHSIDHGDEVISWLKANPVDAILLDLMLPGKDGLTLCKEIRQFSETPILITTAKVEEIDRLLGLELGADDYICKPYSPREVVARVKAVLRRSTSISTSASSTQTDIEEPFSIDESRLSISFIDQTLIFTAIEFQLLQKLAIEPGRIYSRSQLMDTMYNDHRIVSERTIDSHIKKLRKKLADHYPQHDFIHSIYGAGYRFDIINTEKS